MTAIGPGMRVKCIKRGEWLFSPGGSSWIGPAPKHGEVLAVVEINPERTGLRFDEYMGFWDRRRFIRVDPDLEQLRALLKEVKNPDDGQRPNVPEKECV